MVLEETKVYRARFLMLALFALFSASNAFQWIEYAIISNVISRYYSVDSSVVDWLSMVYFLTYIIFIFPANWILGKQGLRVAVLLGAAGNCIGAWVKCASLSPDLFSVTMTGQLIAAISQVFVLGIPAHLAGIWFGSNEISTATAVGVFGNQLGIAIGFVVPPLIVKKSEGKEEETKGLSILFYGGAAITTFILLMIAFFFKDKPKLPPSTAQAALRDQEDDKDGYWQSTLNLCKNMNFMFLLIAYGINVGAFYSISTLLNRMVLSHQNDSEQSAGLMGLLMVISGMIGSVICGIILDKTHKFKEACLVIYVLTVVGMICFTVVLKHGSLLLFFLISVALGFFMTGYLPIGVEFAAEITYPEPEGMSSGLLQASAQIFGITFTIGAGHLLDKYGSVAANIYFIVSLVVGVILTGITKSDLRRQEMANSPYEKAEGSPYSNLAYVK